MSPTSRRLEIPEPGQTCDGGYCDRRAVTAAYHWDSDALIPACRRHLQTYKVLKGRYWQAEDEAYGLPFARRSRWKWLVQWKLLLDQRAAMKGRLSLPQRILVSRRKR